MERVRVGLIIFTLLSSFFVFMMAIAGLFADSAGLLARLIFSILNPLSVLLIIIILFAPKISRIFTAVTIITVSLGLFANLITTFLLAINFLRGDWPVPLIPAAPQLAYLAYVATLRMKSK